MIVHRLPSTGLIACAMLLAAVPCRAQGPGQQGAPPPAPFAFGVMPGGGGTQPSYDQPPGSAPPGAYNPPPFAPQPALQPPPPAEPPVAGGPSQQQLQQLAEAERQDFGVPAPRQLHPGAPHAPTPNTLPGGQLITTLGLVSLLQQPGLRPVLLDALGGQAHLPGALPAVFAAQPGTFNDMAQQQLAALLQQATGGNRTRLIVVYCSDPHCWMSYNAALRAVALEYRNVLWYRGGLWAWQQAGLPLGGQGMAPGPGAVPGMPAGLGGGPGPATPRTQGGFRQDGPMQGGGGQGTGGQGTVGQGGAFTMGDLGQAVTYGRDRDWTTSASPDGALLLANPGNPSGWLVDTVRQPALPFTMEMEVTSNIGTRPGAAVGAGAVFAYNRGQAGESFYTLLLSGNTAVLYYRHDGTFDELSRTSTAGGDRATLRITVRQDGFSFSVNGNGVVSQDADGPMTGRYGVMASGMGQAGFRNLRLR